MNLAPKHLADLRKSSLTDATIAACAFESVRPHDIKLAGVESAYEIPYHNIDGSQNCANRLKLFPPIIDKDGHKRKYHQQASTDPQLYLPPLLNWQKIASDPQQSIVITEGEKKAAALSQWGIPTIGAAGVWSWGQQLDTGQRLVIPTLDLFVWKDRPVEITPDSDLWRPEKQQGLQGFYALAMELVSRGAHVVVVRLTEAGQGKVGLDDFLVQHPADWQRLFPMLERIALDDARFKPVAKWWQGWRERHATEDAIRERIADQLQLTEVAGLYVVRSEKHGVIFTFDRLTDQRSSVYAELSVRLGKTDLLDAVDLNLKSDGAHAEHAASLNTFSAGIPWKLLVQKACALVLRHYRTGPPLVTISAHSPVEPVTYSINPLVFSKKTTILYGDGGLGKSSLALLIGMCVSVGHAVAGVQAIQGKTLYVDYEDDERVHAQRLHAILRGHPELTAAEISYQRCVEPLTRVTHGLARQIQTQGITFLVLDSIMAATGGDSSAEAATKLFAALRALNVECLALGHVPKTQAEGTTHHTVYGSVFHQNFARSVWEIQKQQEVGEDGSVLGLFHRKSNLSRLHHPIGLKVQQASDGNRIRYEACDLDTVAELADKLPLPSRIRNLLESDGTPRTSKQIADELGEKLTVVRTTLGREHYKNKKWSVLPGGSEKLYTALRSRNG